MEQPKSLKEKDIKQVIILRKDLNMRKGKMCAQASHASMAVIFNYMLPNYLNPYTGVKWLEPFHFDIDLPRTETGEEMREWMTGMFKKIVVGVDSLAELVNIYQTAKAAGLPCSLIEDKGLTEFGGEITITACAIGPCAGEKIDPITGKLTLL
jgi:PTH2 family peptidyl-tRNA hydrolase